MFTDIRNSKTNKYESTVLSCNVKGCKVNHAGKTHAEAWTAARKAGWLMGKNGNEVCENHRSGYKLVDGILTVREAKAEKAATPSKGKVAQSKVERKATDKATKTTKSGAKLTVGNRVPAKSQPAAFSGGQSIGKPARTAKK